MKICIYIYKHIYAEKVVRKIREEKKHSRHKDKCGDISIGGEIVKDVNGSRETNQNRKRTYGEKLFFQSVDLVLLIPNKPKFMAQN
jgi:hypothetical protein